jgi:WD40 repeat protein
MMKVETRENGVSPDRVDRNEFSSYLELVAAKRKRNQEWLEQSGLLNVAKLRDVKQKSSSSEKKGIVADNKKGTTKEVARRKSSRLAGFKAMDMYVEEERGGKFQIGGASTNEGTESLETIHQKRSLTYKNRLNDGEDISLAQAVMLCDKKWSTDTSVSDAGRLFSEYLEPLVSRSRLKVHATSLASEKTKRTIDISPYNISNLDAVEVAKVTPDRIYSVACHPSSESLIVVAGDKTGHIGLWNVDGQAKDSSGTFSLFHVHSSPVSCLEWVGSGSGLLSASYDGTIRWMDVETKTFSQLFATFDSSQQFDTSLGFGMEDGIRSWIQFCCLDTRFGSEKCFFLSNSSGNAYHVDLREKGIVTFHENLSEKKINTLRYVYIQLICKHLFELFLMIFYQFTSRRKFTCICWSRLYC